MNDDRQAKVVLVVEDEDLVAQLYERTLKDEKIAVQVARDGEEALTMLKQGGKPDLVVLDIMMPKINGMRVLEEIKADEKTKDVKVIVLSNLSGELDMKLAVEKGALDYWVKSDVPPKEMLKRVKKILGLAE